MPLHVVFSAECIPAFDWQSVGLFYSFYHSKQPGRITRLLACEDEQLRVYPKVNLEMGPTFVHKNMRYDEMNEAEKFDQYHDGKGRGYASYNKPYSVMAWLEQTHVEEEMVLMMDTDMFLRAPVDPVALGVRRGNVVSAEYSYLYGTQSGFAKRFLERRLLGRLAQVGGFHIFHREDLRAIAPKWLGYTRKVRAFANAHPEEYFNESIRHDPKLTRDEVAVLRKQARWHGEMYGYVFAAAEVGVTHRIRRDVMLYPGYEPYLGRPPMIMHYGAAYTLGAAYFNKMEHQKLTLETCPMYLFPDAAIGNVEQLTKKDALSLEHLATMNAAFCSFYGNISCPSTPARCGGVGGKPFLGEVRRARTAIERCVDDHEGCTSWARGGECKSNPLFMHTHCAVACGSCNKPIDSILSTEAEMHMGDWRAKEETQRKHQLGEALEYIPSAEIEEIEKLEAAIAERREVLAMKHEL